MVQSREVAGHCCGGGRPQRSRVGHGGKAGSKTRIFSWRNVRKRGSPPGRWALGTGEGGGRFWGAWSQLPGLCGALQRCLHLGVDRKRFQSSSVLHWLESRLRAVVSDRRVLSAQTQAPGLHCCLLSSSGRGDLSLQGRLRARLRRLGVWALRL